MYQPADKTIYERAKLDYDELWMNSGLLSTKR